MRVEGAVLSEVIEMSQRKEMNLFYFQIFEYRSEQLMMISERRIDGRKHEQVANGCAALKIQKVLQFLEESCRNATFAGCQMGRASLA